MLCNVNLSVCFTQVIFRRTHACRSTYAKFKILFIRAMTLDFRIIFNVKNTFDIKKFLNIPIHRPTGVLKQKVRLTKNTSATRLH